MKKLILLTLLMCFTQVSFSQQEPPTNAPSLIFPLFDDYMTAGFERNHIKHTNRFNWVSYVYVGDLDITTFDEYYYYVKWGDTTTFLVHRVGGPDKFYYLIAINENWANNYYVFRRMFFKAIGLAEGMSECHTSCTHIMSAREIIDTELFFYDLDESNWERELTIYYNYLDFTTTKISEKEKHSLPLGTN